MNTADDHIPNHPHVNAAIDAMREAGETDEAIGHALISAGLYQLADNLCTEHLIEQLQFVRAWIGDRIEETKQEAN